MEDRDYNTDSSDSDEFYDAESITSEHSTHSGSSASTVRTIAICYIYNRSSFLFRPSHFSSCLGACPKLEFQSQRRIARDVHLTRRVCLKGKGKREKKEIECLKQMYFLSVEIVVLLGTLSLQL